MSQENVEIVRAIIDAVNRQDFEAAFKHASPDAQVDMSRAAGPVHGVFTMDQWRRTLKEDLAETWESLHIETHEFIEAGERVVVQQALHGRGRYGIEVAASATFVWTVRDGVVQHVEMYQERQHALEAVGLREPMSQQENVEIVRKTIEAYVVGDREAYYDFMAEDIEIRPDVSRWPEAEPFCGREEFRRFNADIDQDWEGGARAEIREVFPVDDRVVVRADWGGTGRASGIDLRSNLTSIFTVRDGQIIKIEYFFDHAKALEAAGLRE